MASLEMPNSDPQMAKPNTGSSKSAIAAAISSGKAPNTAVIPQAAPANPNLQPPLAILVRLVPTSPLDATSFSSYLSNLTINAYADGIEALSGPLDTTPGTVEWSIGTASTSQTNLLWVPALYPPFVVEVEAPTTSNGPPTFVNTIFQHFNWDSNSPLSPATLLSVATAVVLVTVPTSYPSYPTNTSSIGSTSFNVRVSLQRNVIPLDAPEIEWDVQCAPLPFYSPTAFPYMYDVENFGVNQQYNINNPTSYGVNPSLYASLPPPLPSSPTTTLISLSNDGTPPAFQDIVNAVNPVIASYNLGGSSLSSLPLPLTLGQCNSIASMVVYNPATQKLPVPVPEYPQNSGIATIEDLYSTGSTTADGVRRQFEGNLTSFHATNDSTSQKMAPFIFAASAAIWAEYQTIQAQTAVFSFPVLQTTGPTAAVILSSPTLGSPLPSNFCVPASYFYALTADYPTSSDAAHRYAAILSTTADSIYKKLLQAEKNGIVGNSELPATASAPQHHVSDVAAVWKLAALSANYVSGSLPTLVLTGSVKTLVDGWIKAWHTFSPATLLTTQSPLTFINPYWTTSVFSGTDYLNIMLLVASQIPSYPPAPPPANEQWNFLNALTTTKLVPTGNPAPADHRVIQTAADLPTITNSDWLGLFQNLLQSDAASVPSWCGPGTAQQQVQAWMNWIQTLFSVGYLEVPSTTPTGNSVGALGSGFDSNVLADFFTAYATKFSPGLDFSVQLNTNNISAILTKNPSFSDPNLQQWINTALQVLSTLYTMTNITTTTTNPSSQISPTLQFSYMEALYSRGFTSAKSIALLSQDQFTAALTGTVAYPDALAIYTAATTPPPQLPPTPPEPGSGFQPINPGDLVNCIPPPNLSPFGPISYLQDLLNISLGSDTIESAIASRRGPISTTLTATYDNLEVKVPAIDLVNESLESIGNNLASPQGAVYNTTDIAGLHYGHENSEVKLLERYLRVVPQNSSPAISVSNSPVYNTLKTTYSSPQLPYSQGLDICRSYLFHLGTNRSDTMRHFRQNISEIPFDLTMEPADFIKYQWRLPVRLEIALEYLQVSMDEFKTLWTANLTTTFIAQLYGVEIGNANAVASILTVYGFIQATGLTYCQFWELSNSGIVPMSPENGSQPRLLEASNGTQVNKFPNCAPCCLESLGISFGSEDPTAALTILIIFIRLWRKLNLQCHKDISMQALADVCSILNLFTSTSPPTLNNDFLRQLASLLMLIEMFDLPLTDRKLDLTAAGAERTKILAIWAGSSVSSPTKTWAITAFLNCIGRHAQKLYGCPDRGSQFVDELSKNLDEVSTLAGFTSSNPWSFSPTCSIRFAEIMSKLYASNFSIGDIIFLFTINEHLNGDDPFQLSGHVRALDDPFDLPDESPYELASLRRKLLEVEISEESLEKWNWFAIESALKDAGFPTSTNGGDPLLGVAQHYFPHILEGFGYNVSTEQQRYSTPLAPRSTSPAMWNAPLDGPFHYAFGPSNNGGSSDAMTSDEGSSGRLWIQLSFKDKDVLKQLKVLRQLNPSEIYAVQNLYFAPRLALVPLTPIFSNFRHAVQYLISETSEHKRFRFFLREVATFKRRCEIIAEHLAEHVKHVACAQDQEQKKLDIQTAYKILVSLVADENFAESPWENDQGTPPTQFMVDPKFLGGAFAAILGLIGTGAEGQYDTDSVLKWLEMRGGTAAFGVTEDEVNVPIPIVIPALNLTPSTNESDDIRFKNGMIIDKHHGSLGGGQPFNVSWNGCLIISKSGHYRFGAGRPSCEEEMPRPCEDQKWEVSIRRGQKNIILLGNLAKDVSLSLHVSPSTFLQRGVYHITIRFKQEILFEDKHAAHHAEYHAETGFIVKYNGPDTDGCPVVIPFECLIRDSKSGPFRLSDENNDLQLRTVVTGNVLSDYLMSQYYSTIRDVRRTYQRTFKALLFTSKLRLSAKEIYSDHESELGYMLNHGDRFTGTSYYLPAGSTSAVLQSHYANFNFNFLPVMDDYIPAVASDSRAKPSVKRQQALFDWFERIFDYVHLRNKFYDIKKPPIWMLFQEMAIQNPTDLSQYVRRLGIELNLSSLALQYFNNPMYSVSATDLLNERWPIRLWHIHNWICKLSCTIYSRLLKKALPALWASDDPTATIGSSSGNSNLVTLVDDGLSFKNGPFSARSVKQLNDGLRLKAREALIAYLTTMNRVVSSTPSGFVIKPSDLSDLLLQDVEAKLWEKSTRIDDAIYAVKFLIQRARLGLESSIQLTSAFKKDWEDHFSSFEKWLAWKKKSLYNENWIQWDELRELESFEGARFLKQELSEYVSSIVEPGKPMWWAGDNYPQGPPICPIQLDKVLQYSLEQGSTATFEGLSLLGTPLRDAQPSLLAADIVLQDTTSSQPALTTPSKAIVKASKQPLKLAATSGLGTLETLPLWVQAAVRLGTQFIRVAAAGVPPAFRYNNGDSYGKSYRSTCNLTLEDVVDEYYFWLQDSTYYNDSQAQQNADIGSSSAIDPSTDWENTNDATTIPQLLFWPTQPLLHLAWTRLRMNRLDPPRRSDEGIPYDPTASTPLLQFTGRVSDSLTFNAFTSDSSSSTPVSLFTGFRYDLATDSVVLTPQTVADTLPQITQPVNFQSFPTFLYFDAGKPLVPTSSLGISLAMAAAARNNCAFEAALSWCQLAFDPFSRVNTWAQCPKTDNNTSTDSTRTVFGIKLTAAAKASSTAPTNIATTASASTVPGTTATAQKSTQNSTVKSLAREPSETGDLPCCPCAPVSIPVAHARAVALEFLKILEQWGDHLLTRCSPESSNEALVVFRTMDRLLGPTPPIVKAHDKSDSSSTIANFVPYPPPLNPELLRLYDVAKDRKATILEGESRRRLPMRALRIKFEEKQGYYGYELKSGCGYEDCFARCQPYRFNVLLAKALEAVNMVKSLGTNLLSALEKGDNEYLEAIRQAQERKLLDIGLQAAQNAWRAADWDVQALDESMQSALTRLHYYQGLISNGLNAGETGYQSATENAMQSQNASNTAEGASQAANIIPDIAFGVAGMGPLESNTIPIGTKLANALSTEARIMSMIGTISSTNGGLQLTQAGWARRSQDWQNNVNVISIEIQQIKQQDLAAWRRRDSALHDLNSHQQQMDHAAEIQNFLRDKLTKHELYLFLQQETVALYRQAYRLSVQIAQDTQTAFKFERGETIDLLSNLSWDSLHEGLTAGDRLEMSLRAMDRAYMQLNCREYEITKNFSTKLHFPDAFIRLKCHGYCEIEIPEWIFDLDYPGHYMRRIKSLSISLAAVASSLTSVNCRVQLLSSNIRVTPLLPAEELCCCHKESDDCCDSCNDPYVARYWGCTEAICTSDGRVDNGLFQLDFKDERYLPFEYRGAVSRWRIEIPPKNNQFDLSTLTDVVLNLNYTSREGGHQLRQKADECAQRHLPGNGIRFFDIRHDFPEAWRVYQMEGKGAMKHGYRELPLRFSRSMFPYLVGKRRVRISSLHLFIIIEERCEKYIRVAVEPVHRDFCAEKVFVCIVDDVCPSAYHGKVDVDFDRIEGNVWSEFGKLVVEKDIRACEAYLLVRYEAFWGEGCGWR